MELKFALTPLDGPASHRVLLMLSITTALVSSPVSRVSVTETCSAVGSIAIRCTNVYLVACNLRDFR